MKTLIKITLSTLLFFSLCFATGCGEKSASDKVEDAADEAADAVGDAAESVEDAVN